MRDAAAKSEYDRQRYLRRRVDRRPATCGRDGCENRLAQPRHGQRLYCSTSCKERAWYRANYVPIPRTYDVEPLPAAYTGHRWLDMARVAVNADDLRPGTEVADRRFDEMGEAVLAILEGRDADQAVIDFRKREFRSRHLTKHISDWSGDDSIDTWHYWEAILPTTPSAEDEAMARINGRAA